MELPVIYLVIIVLVAAVFFWVTLQSRQGPRRTPPGGRPSQRPRLESSRTPTASSPRRETWGASTSGMPQQRERRDARQAPLATAPQRDSLEQAGLEVQLDWSTGQSQQGRERASRPEVSTVATAGRQALGQPTAPVLPSRSWRIGGKRARPEMLASPRKARQAFLAMELLRPPLALRKEGEDVLGE